MKSVGLVLCSALGLAAAGCGGDDDSGGADYKPVNEQYAANVYASYSDTLTSAKALQAAVDAFVAAPSQATQDAAKAAWKAAREPYLQTEVFRFYDGPIDNPEDGPEGLINAWPMDEVFVDYVVGSADAGIINDVAGFPTITTEIIAGENENGGEANISTGYHAIEFLLWGQDLSATGPGARPFTDYLTTGGTAANQDRRKTYLSLVTDLLVDDLTQVTEAWAPGAAYRVEFEAGGKDSVQKILVGMGSLSGAELSGERMTVALDNGDQEDEHSCFSDNTDRDIHGNGLGIQNVYLGKYGATDGVGIVDLVRAVDATLADKLQTQMADTMTKIDAIPKPFDQQIIETNAAGRALVRAAIEALQLQTETTVEAATALGITINLE